LPVPGACHRRPHQILEMCTAALPLPVSATLPVASLNYPVPHPHTLSTAVPELSLAINDHQPTPSVEERCCAAELCHPSHRPGAWVSLRRPLLARCTPHQHSVLELAALLHLVHQRAAARRTAVGTPTMVTACVTHTTRTERHGPYGSYCPLGLAELARPWA
jgi:hypothetical protein